MKITIYEEPLAKARPRTYMRNNKSFTYDPQHREKQHTQQLLKNAVNEHYQTLTTEDRSKLVALLKGNKFHISVDFFMPIPKSYSKNEINSILWGLERHTQKDLDNLLKYFSDCANGILWPDDRLIDRITATKRYSNIPRTEIMIQDNNDVDLKPETKKVLSIIEPKDMIEFIKMVGQLEESIDISCIDDQHNYSNADLNKIVDLWLLISCQYADKLKKIERFSHGKITC